MRYDAIIVGGSRAATFLAPALAQAGWRTVVVEREHLGGTCVNVGCTPTKTMVASARIAHLARRAADYGVHAGPVTVDLAAVRQRKGDLVDWLRKLPEGLIEATDGLDLIFGQASFTGPRSLEVRVREGDTEQLDAERIFIDTGARPSIPPVPGLDSVPSLDSTSIMELETLPEHLLVIGGGYIGLEFGQMFRRFGSRVTIAQRDRQLLAREDPDVAEALVEVLREDGIEVLLEAEVREAKEGGGDAVELSVQTAEGTRTLSGSHLLVAAGRVPNTEGLGLEAAGVTMDERGFIAVNDRLETSAPGIYAFGDVTPGPPFTHAAFDDFRILRANLLEGGDASTTGRLVPYVVFTDPQLGRVGLTETEARAQGRAVRVASLPMNYPAPSRARELGETRGLMKVVVEAKTGEILGAAILSVEGGEIMATLQVAMMSGMPYTAIRDAIFAHPTLAESLNDLLMALDKPMPMEMPTT
jgi:pyruvate/2-oxoglutarate dehydrogenase complex dihydrolipoamide dehydrogenase (E3) component